MEWSAKMNKNRLIEANGLTGLMLSVCLGIVRLVALIKLACMEDNRQPIIIHQSHNLNDR